MFTIENQHLKVTIQARGAELTGLYHKTYHLQYLWNGDAAYWAKHSPVLFPIVGALKNNTYLYQGRSFQLSRHGFAREQVFEVENQAFDSITFLLRSTEELAAIYPFPFELRIRYILYENSLAVVYEVSNPGRGNLYFSLGAHPAFNVPLIPGTAYEDYYLAFDQVETAARWPISAAGLIEEAPQPFLQHTGQLPLTKELFQKDALVFKDLQSTRIALRSDRTPHGLEVDFAGFPFMGIWAAKNAPFVCIEPWCGIADGVNTNQELEQKEGIEMLEPHGSFVRTWRVTLL